MISHILSYAYNQTQLSDDCDICSYCISMALIHIRQFATLNGTGVAPVLQEWASVWPLNMSLAQTQVCQPDTRTGRMRDQSLQTDFGC